MIRSCSSSGNSRESFGTELGLCAGKGEDGGISELLEGGDEFDVKDDGDGRTND